jgi:ribonucleotide monophosphatase NagD (HAD superfamily)
MVRIKSQVGSQRNLTAGAGKQVVFVTNNSTKSRADYRKKLEGLGIPSTVVSPLEYG